MPRANGKADTKQPPSLDLEHELPAAEPDDGNPTAGTEAGTSENQSAPAAELSETEREIERLKAERDQLYDRLARLQAEFENSRKRASREQQEFRDYAVADAIKKLLPIVDSFELALRSPSQDGAEFRAGIELILRQLQDALGKVGIVAVPAKGEPFNPHLHEAVEVVETSDFPENSVIEELQRGYRLKDRLLRPAMVRVARRSR
jgi:molecular chaperone GrpE